MRCKFAGLGPIAILAIIGVFVGLILATSCAKPHPSESTNHFCEANPDDNLCIARPVHTCVAGPDEVCPSDLWWKDYDRLQYLNKKYGMPQDKQDEVAGIASRLRSQIKQGYEWSEDKQRLVLSKTPPAPERKP